MFQNDLVVLRVRPHCPRESSAVSKRCWRSKCVKVHKIISSEDARALTASAAIRKPTSTGSSPSITIYHIKKNRVKGLTLVRVSKRSEGVRLPDVSWQACFVSKVICLRVVNHIRHVLPIWLNLAMLHISTSSSRKQIPCMWSKSAVINRCQGSRLGYYRLWSSVRRPFSHYW